MPLDGYGQLAGSALLPDRDGASLAAEMRTWYWSDVPVIVMRALDPAAGATAARDAHAVAFLEKPFDLDDRVAVVTIWLG